MIIEISLTFIGQLFGVLVCTLLITIAALAVSYNSPRMYSNSNASNFIARWWPYILIWSLAEGIVISIIFEIVSFHIIK